MKNKHRRCSSLTPWRKSRKGRYTTATLPKFSCRCDKKSMGITRENPTWRCGAWPDPTTAHSITYSINRPHRIPQRLPTSSITLSWATIPSRCPHHPHPSPSYHFSYFSPSAKATSSYWPSPASPLTRWPQSFSTNLSASRPNWETTPK